MTTDTPEGLAAELAACDIAPFPHSMSESYVVLVDEDLRNRILTVLKPEAVAEAVWQPIETAPKDGTPILAACFNPPWAESHLKGDIERCWWHPKFEAFITSCREMSLAPGLTFEDGTVQKQHSPNIAHYRSHWISLPPNPPIRAAGSTKGLSNG